MKPVKSLAAAALLAGALCGAASAHEADEASSPLAPEMRLCVFKVVVEEMSVPHAPLNLDDPVGSFGKTGGGIMTNRMRSECNVQTAQMRSAIDLMFAVILASAKTKEEEERKAAWHRAHPDPGAVSLCPPPHKMTARDGCQ